MNAGAPAEQASSGGDTKEGERAATASGGTGEIAGKSTAAGAQQCRGEEMLVTAVNLESWPDATGGR
ncbi:hypothetical protein [Streptomyces monashensis]|uniref:hypothetical protein n=1 Tax=Streptomyces monashensis TaxID=1678012 RepID=UPI00116063D5|nr:hypothetical protein [Streptomyces monashensis]